MGSIAGEGRLNTNIIMRISATFLLALVCLASAGLLKDFEEFGKKEVKWLDKISKKVLKGGEDLFKGFKKGKKDEDCKIVWEEHKQPHCSTEYEQICKEEHIEECTTEYEKQCVTENERQCTTEYSQNCVDEYNQECKTWNEKICSTNKETQCKTEYEKQCSKST